MITWYKFKCAATGKESALPFLVIFGGVLIAFGLWFGNRHGWEGDDTNFIFGAVNLDLVGREYVYRYAWQPLAYEAISQLVRIGIKPVQLFYLSNISGMLGVFLLAVLSARLLGNTIAAASFASLLILGIPELWITALYFNTTAFGLPFFAASLLILSVVTQQRNPSISGSIAGILFATACLFRLDFLTALPMMLVFIFLWQKQRIVIATYFIVSQAAIYIAFSLAQHDLPSQLFNILMKFGTESFPGWTFTSGAKVFLAAVAPSLITIPILLWDRIYKVPRLFNERGGILVLIALLPTLLSATKLYSGKYLVIFFVCLILILSTLIGRLSIYPAPDLPSLQRRIAAWLVIALMFVLGFPQHEAFKSDPIDAILHKPGVIWSHDGPRTLGGYKEFAAMMRATEIPSNSMELFRIAELSISRCEGNFEFVMPRSDWFWANLMGALSVGRWHLLKYSFLEEAVFESEDSRVGLHIVTTRAAISQEKNRSQLIDFSPMSGPSGLSWITTTQEKVRALNENHRCLTSDPLASN